ncbi:MAG: LysR family transcriptional regulator [Methyloligellaceae bacterium]
MNLAGIDLNLLLVFDAVMSERHVTRAGQRIGMSQPAMSNALNRLRHHLEDELFVRGADGMRPTPRALELAEPIHSALAEIETALDPAVFEPATANRTFRIGTNDYAVTTLIPTLAARLGEEAPGVNIRTVPSAGRTLEMLDDQEIDFGIAAFADIPERFDALSLIEDIFVVMMRRHHPLAKRPLTLGDYAAAKHLLVSPRGDGQGYVDTELRAHGLTRQIAVTINNFSSIPAILAASDLIVTTPKRVADIFAPLYDFHTLPAPVPGPHEFSTATLVWHRRLAGHPAHVWFRELLEGVARDLS